MSSASQRMSLVRRRARAGATTARQAKARSARARAARYSRDFVLFTPDARYLIVAGRLWRATNPKLRADVRDDLIDQLMAARRNVNAAMRSRDRAALARARAQVHAAKVSLGERGPVWWQDGSPDLTRHSVLHSPYAEWYAAQALHDSPD